MGWRGAWTTLREMAADGGRGTAALYILHRFLQGLHIGRVVPYMLVAQPIGAGNGAYAALRPDPGTAVAPLQPGDALAGELPRPGPVNQARWRAGAVCHACTVKGRLAGTIWIQRNHYDEDEVRCRYRLASPADSVWDFDVYLAPPFRLGRTMARMWQAVDAELAGQGVRWSFSRISRFNGASLRSHARLGAVGVGNVLFIVLGPLQLAWLPGRLWPRLDRADAHPGAGAPVLDLHRPGPQGPGRP